MFHFEYSLHARLVSSWILIWLWITNSSEISGSSWTIRSSGCRRMLVEIIVPVSLRSSTFGSRVDSYKARFIFKASRRQLEIPTNPYRLFSTSSSACNTFNGLCGESSARPISSKTITDNNSDWLLTRV